MTWRERRDGDPVYFTQPIGDWQEEGGLNVHLAHDAGGLLARTADGRYWRLTYDDLKVALRKAVEHQDFCEAMQDRGG